MSRTRQGITFFCEVCNISCPSQYQWDEHLLGEQHRKRTQQQQPALTVRCRTCGLYFKTAQNLRVHFSLTGHIGLQVLDTAPPSPFWCPDCQKDSKTANELKIHMQSDAHLRRVAHDAPHQEETSEQSEEETWCDVCDRECGTSHNLQVHLGGRQHARMVAVRGVTVEQPQEDDEPDSFWCEVCKLDLAHKNNWDLHIAGRKHRIAAERDNAWCELCNVHCESLVSFNQHLQGERHRENVRNRGGEEPLDNQSAISRESGGNNKGPYYCEDCDMDLKNINNYNEHLRGRRHQQKIAGPIPPCVPCNRSFVSLKERDDHMKSRKHLENTERVAAQAEDALNNLDQMNQWLISLGEEAQLSKTKAREALRAIYINIFDLVNHRFDMRHKNLRSLRKYSMKNKLIFPKDNAKGSQLKLFLRKMFYRS